jgi:hypothetical protein
MRKFLMAAAAFLAGFAVCRTTAKPPPPPPEVRGAVLVDEYGAAALGLNPVVLRTMPNEDGSVRVIVKVTGSR